MEQSLPPYDNKSEFMFSDLDESMEIEIDKDWLIWKIVIFMHIAYIWVYLYYLNSEIYFNYNLI